MPRTRFVSDIFFWTAGDDSPDHRGIDAIYSAGAEQVDPTACRTKFSALMKMIPVWRDTLRRVWLKTAVLSLRCRPGANGIEG